jgi:hypothetical protein
MRSNLSNIQKKSAYGCLSAADSKIRIFSEAFFLNGSERKWTVSQSQLDFGFLFALFFLFNGLDCLKFELLYSGMTHLTRFLPASFAL